MRNNHYLFVILLIVRLFTQFSPALELRTPFFISFPLLVFLVFYAINRGRGLVHKVLLMVPIYIVPFLNLIAANRGNIPLVNLLYVLFQWFAWPLLGIFVAENLTLKAQKKLLWVYLLCISITALTTSYGCTLFPSASRAMANGDFAENEIEVVSMYRSMNIGNFQYIYTSVLIIPLVLCLSNYHRKKICYLITALLLFTIYKTEYTTALLLSVISTLFLISPISKNAQVAKKWLVPILIITLLSLPLIGGIMNFIASEIGSEQISQRFSELSMSLHGQQLEEDSDFGTRLFLWSKSIKTFFENFFTGVYFTTDVNDTHKYIGGHSFILDSMARFGILGFLAIVWMFKRLYRIFILPYGKRPEYIYILTVFLLNIIQCMINTISIEFVFVFLIPLLMSVMPEKKVVLLNRHFQ